MSDDKNINISIGSKLVDDTMENLLDKPTKSIGETFNDIWFLTLGGPIGNLAEKRKLKYAIELEKYKNDIEHEIDKIPQGKRTEGDIYFIGMVLESSKYCAGKETLRRMFAKLIASSMNIDKKEYVHPIMVNIIRQLAPLDAFLFNEIAGIKSGASIETSAYNLTISFSALEQLGLIERKVSKDKKKNNLIFDAIYDFKSLDKAIGKNNVKSKIKDITIQISSNDEEGMELKEYFKLTKLGDTFKELCL